MIINCLEKTNALIDRGTESLAKDILLPAIISTYQTTGDLSIAVAGLFSKALSALMENLFYDPLSTSSILKITNFIEKWTLPLAKRKPISFPHFAHYIDCSLTSVIQNFYLYMKCINDLLKVPENLKSFIHCLSFETAIYRAIPGKDKWANLVIIELKRGVLAIVNVAIRIMDLLFQAVLLGIQFGPFSYIEEIITYYCNHIHEHFAINTINSISKKEAELRKEIVASGVETVLEYLLTWLTSVAAKSLTGAVVYLSLKHLLSDRMGLPQWVVQGLGVAVVSHITWKNVIVPTLDPYYNTYYSHFRVSNLTFYEFCNYYEILHLYPVAALARHLFRKKTFDPPKVSYFSNWIDQLFPTC